MYNIPRTPLDMLAAMRSGGHHHPHHAEHPLRMWDEWASGKQPIPDAVKAVILYVLKENTDHIMSSHGYVSTDHQSAPYDMARHRKFKEVIEELKDAPSLEVDKLIAERFHGLTPEEHRVIKTDVQGRSKRKKAELSGVGSKDRFLELMHSAESKLT